MIMGDNPNSHSITNIRKRTSEYSYTLSTYWSPNLLSDKAFGVLLADTLLGNDSSGRYYQWASVELEIDDQWAPYIFNFFVFNYAKFN